MLARLLRKNVAYVIGSAANSAALFVLIPYLVNALPAADYGAWALLEIGVMFLTLLMTLGLEVGMMREYWYMESDDDRRNLAGTVILGVTCWSLITIVVGGAILLAFGWGPEPLGAVGLVGIGAVPLLLILLIAMLEALLQVALSLLRIREQAMQFVLISAGRLVVLVGMVIGGFQALGTIEGALIGRLLTSLVSLGVALWLVRRLVRLSPNLPALLRMLRYSLPLLPTGVASYILLASDRYLLQYVAGLEVVAIYNFAYKLATSLDVMVTRPFALDWAPRRFKIAALPEHEARQTYARVLVLYLFVAFAFALLVDAATSLVYNLIAPEVYRAGALIVPVILLAYIIYGASFPLNIGIMLRDRTVFLLPIALVSVVVCLGLNLLLIPAYGMLGAAWATVGAYVIYTLSITLFSLRLYPVPYSARDLGLVLIGAGVVFVGNRLLFLASPLGGELWLTTVVRVGLLAAIFCPLGVVLFTGPQKSVAAFVRRLRASILR